MVKRRDGEATKTILLSNGDFAADFRPAAPAAMARYLNEVYPPCGVSCHNAGTFQVVDFIGHTGRKSLPYSAQWAAVR